jgi:hypothetical protein
LGQSGPAPERRKSTYLQCFGIPWGLLLLFCSVSGRYTYVAGHGDDQVRHLTNGVIELRGILRRDLGDGVISGAEGGGMERKEGRQMLCGWGYSSWDLHLPVLALALESLGSWEKKMHKSGVCIYSTYTSSVSARKQRNTGNPVHKRQPALHTLCASITNRHFVYRRI